MYVKLTVQDQHSDGKKTQPFADLINFDALPEKLVEVILRCKPHLGPVRGDNWRAWAEVLVWQYNQVEQHRAEQVPTYRPITRVLLSAEKLTQEQWVEATRPKRPQINVKRK